MSDEAARLLREQEQEYSQYVAVENIVIDGGLAYTKGQAVSATAVHNGTVPRSAVQGPKTKGATAAIAEATGQES